MGLVRYGISLPDILSEQFDRMIREKNYANRSEALRDLIRKELVTAEIDQNEEVVGVVNLLYNHHKRELSKKLTDLQHQHHRLILSAMHIHLDHDNCIEVIILRGMSQQVRQLGDLLIASKGVKHGTISLTSTGKNIG